MTRLLVLDFDGTLTDAEEEGKPFTQGYLDDLALLTDGSREEIGKLAARFASEIGPNDGWIFRGQIVAPACVDPYLRIMPVARRILDHYGRFMDQRDRELLLDRILYKHNYGKTVTAFRKGAFRLLNALPRTATWIVTNSATEPVQRKITDLGWKRLQARGGNITLSANPLNWLKERVVGSAKKYENNPDWDGVMESEMWIPGLDRPVLLRRRRYYETLDRLRDEAGNLEWPEVTVVGDIFELDLALPLALGAHIVLTANEHTPPCEVDFLSEHPNARVVRSISELREFLGC